MTIIDLASAATVEGASQGLSAYVATPSGGGPWPGVVVVHEAFGVDDVMRCQVDRLAAAGYLAIMVHPDPQSEDEAARTQPPAAVPDSRATCQTVLDR